MILRVFFPCVAYDVLIIGLFCRFVTWNQRPTSKRIVPSSPRILASLRYETRRAKSAFKFPVSYARKAYGRMPLINYSYWSVHVLYCICAHVCGAFYAGPTPFVVIFSHGLSKFGCDRFGVSLCGRAHLYYITFRETIFSIFHSINDILKSIFY